MLLEHFEKLLGSQNIYSFKGQFKKNYLSTAHAAANQFYFLVSHPTI